MPSGENNSSALVHGARNFATTHWSVVLRAGDSQSPQSAEALEALCRAYWYPLYAFVRRSGQGPEEARDLTQAFFAALLERKTLAQADPARGRFRSFLLASLKFFLTNEWRRARSLRRGHGRELIALDALEAEQRYALEPRHNCAPDVLYERQWALTVIARAQDRLREEMRAAGEGQRFEELEPTLVGERTAGGYLALAARYGLSEEGVKSIVHRLRHRFRALLHEEIAQTLGDGQTVEEELQELLAVLRRPKDQFLA